MGTFFTDVWDILRQYHSFILKGVGITMLISLVGTIAGFLIGLLTGMIRTAPKPKILGMRILRRVIVSINTGAYMAEIVRGGIISIDKGQFEGATSIGMSHSQTMLHVILPQVVRNILPSVSNEFVINIKDTSVLNVIGVTELYYFAGIIKRQNFQTFQTYFVVCVVYFILTFSVTCLLRFIEKKLDGKENYTIFGSQSDPNAEIHVKKEEAIPRD